MLYNACSLDFYKLINSDPTMRSDTVNRIQNIFLVVQMYGYLEMYRRTICCTMHAPWTWSNSAEMLVLEMEGSKTSFTIM